MSDFPALKSGALAQYPVARGLAFGNEAVTFLDGSEQWFRTFGAPLRRWLIRLELLDEREMATLEAFFLQQQGGFGSFSFTDPADGVVYPDCSLEGDFSAAFEDEMRGAIALVVRENRT